MPDILDVWYDDFALAVMMITDELRVSEGIFVTEFEMDDDFADGVAATVAQELATPVYSMKTTHTSSPMGYTMIKKSREIMRVDVPDVIAVPTDLVGVYYFYIERD